MKKELCRTEEKMFKYYDAKADVQTIAARVKEIEHHIEEIDKDLATTNVKIEYHQSGMAISERVQTSGKNTSYAENEIMRAVSELIKEKRLSTENVLNLKCKLRKTYDFISEMGKVIKIAHLESDEMKFVEMRYDKGYDMKKIEEELKISQSKTYRTRITVITKLHSAMERLS